MASSSTTPEAKNTEQLDYDLVKKRYFDILKKNPQILVGPLIAKSTIENKIEEILSNPLLANNELAVQIKDGKPRLFLISKAPFVEVLSVEDAFDIVLEYHLNCNHGNVPSTYQELIKIYSVPLFCVNWVIESCNVCHPSVDTEQSDTASSIEKPLVKGTERGIWRMNIVEDLRLVKNPYSSVRYLLIYKENSTNFVVLRPLLPSAIEISIEVMKLFVEYGFPKKVFVPNCLELYQQVSQLVFVIYPAALVPVEISPNTKIFDDDKEEVMVNLSYWMKSMKSIYWDQGCYFVQYALNNTQKFIIRMDKPDVFLGTPFNLFFQYEAASKIIWLEQGNHETENTQQPSTSKNIL